MTENLDRRRPLARAAESLSLPPGFAGMSSTARLRAVLDLPDPGRALRQMRPDEFYLLLNGIGLDDSHDLLAYATPEQRRAVCDMDAWSGSRYVPARFDRLLGMAACVSLDLALSLLGEMDTEQLELHVASSCVVGIAADDEPTSDWTFNTPDNVFVVSCEDEASVAPLRRFLDLLYAAGLQRAHLVLQGLRRDTPSSLEEMALKFRESRLADLGFPPEEERFALWEPFDVAAVRQRVEEAVPEPIEVPPAQALALALAGVREAPLFWRAVSAALPTVPAATLLDRLVALVNKVMAARSADLSDEGAWRDAATDAVLTASIGIEELAGGDEGRAGAVLAVVWPVELYRVGVEAIRPVSLLARRIVADIGGVARLGLFDEETAETVRAGLAFPPELWAAIVEPGARTRRAFATIAEARLARDRLKAALAVVRFARDSLGFDPAVPGGPGRATFANVVATAWARSVLGDAPLPKPLHSGEVGDLLVAAFTGGRIRPAVRERAVALAGGARPDDRVAVASFVDRALDAVEEAIGRLDPAAGVDPRFVGDALIFESGLD